ncbi:glutathione-dependent disulfide-bond oxidoreductase [Oleiphilus sp. HI0009]|uniref:glutathione-dependent disulfide-bond oxidoreductase n=2 Tax=Oleiphilus TaxID=141450 RepID=UPI0007C3D9DE|nr:MULTISPECIES: glutathione-dependent disulfide-bond oxidoreductase [unclassified Oleiphilus]KZX79461.1 glutathione-dependent disulfide-bond oxidoreductase [Oleiphilus sp. HI0009]KZY64431.1 glutathione-dependent disulfide-bond oxidoreductase [Oleiphilus sp. HI0066]KZY69372.1 glutathione-dependent disulfide-bond oxidoreductase [Oleiphilus sp. HI0067]MCH2157510.1 glutathione-dependent disulfide-bond oxidoreductase [Oleiphilaceae bacterium]
MSHDVYEPPKVWAPEEGNGGKFANINRPTSGATHDKELPSGDHPFQLYSLATPNGVKVTMMLEELLQAGHTGAEYDAWPINIMEGDQFGSGFVAINPNSKIPALFDKEADVRIFESGAILFYLAEKFDAFLPKETKARAECMSWLMWQMGAGPFLGGGFGHFYAYAPEKYKYPIDRYTMEVKRQLDLLDKHLADNEYMVGSEYTIADMTIWPWYGVLAQGKLYEAAEFLDVESYKNVQRWTAQVADRPATERGRIVNRAWGETWEQLPIRRSAEDIDKKLASK